MFQRILRVAAFTAALSIEATSVAPTHAHAQTTPLRQQESGFKGMFALGMFGAELGLVIPALLRKFHVAKQHGDRTVTVWGTGTPRREFLYSDDMADACVFLMNLPDDRYTSLLGSDESVSGRFEPPLVNVGVGEDVSIRELAELVGHVVGFDGDLVFDTTKPDGTPRKLMDVSRLHAIGWRAKTGLAEGLVQAYCDFQASESS